MQKMLYHICQAMASSMESCIEELRGQHGVTEWPLDLKACVLKEREVKFAVVEDGDAGRLREKAAERCPPILRDLLEINHQHRPAWSGQLDQT